MLYIKYIYWNYIIDRGIMQENQQGGRLKNKLDSLSFNHKFVPKRHKFESQMRNRLREFFIAVPTQKALRQGGYK